MASRGWKAMAVALALGVGLVPAARGQAAAEKPATPAQSAAGGAKAEAKGAAGTWQGTLATPRQNLRIVLKTAQADGKWEATLYSIDQPGPAIKAAKMTVSGDAVTIDVATIGGTFSGTLSADGKELNGTWEQGPSPTPLKMQRATAETAWEIPPPPPPPKLMAANADPAFEVATIKPNDTGATRMQGLNVNGSNNFSTRASSLSDLISFAYDLQKNQIAGSESWMGEDRYDIQAKPDTEGSPSPAQLKTMIKKLLADRFGLKFHEEKREMAAFVLTVTKGGVKFAEDTSKAPLPGLGFRPGKTGLNFVMRNATMSDFTGLMQILVLDRPVVDETGLTARYDMNFTFTPDDSLFGGHPPPLPPSDSTTEVAPHMFEALEQQTGLKLEAKKTPVKVMVVDHVTKPSAN